MPDREKVIKALECCIAVQKYPDEFDSGCFECPYRPIEKGTCLRLDYMLSDALALLKAQEPRVLTLEEYKALAEKPKEERDPVWEEWPRLESNWAIPNPSYGGYGTAWRCWTSRPTDAQRDEVKWE